MAIPIALNIVTITADRYRDSEIAQFFTGEFYYRFQIVSLLLSIGWVVFLHFLNVLGSTDFSSTILWIAFVWFIVNLAVFYRFIRLVENYATHTDLILRRKLTDYAKSILKI